jgi:hypothetical protein
MTSSTPTIKAVPDGTTGADTTRDPVAELRRDEAQYLISLACRATSAADLVTSQMHAQIYEPDGTPAAETQCLLLAVLTCMETAEHYLRMLDEVLADVPGSGAPPPLADPGEPPF